MRHLRRSVLLPLLLLVSVFAAPGTAHAASSYVFAVQWGSAGTGNGQFGTASDVAVDDAGAVFVVDEEGDRVQRFSPNGKFLGAFSATCVHCSDTLDGPQSIAAGDGVVWVADTQNSQLVRYSSAGAFQARLASPGPFRRGAFGQPTGVAVDGSGRVYVVGTANTKVHVFNPDGSFVRDITVPLGAATTNTIDVDADDNLYVTTLVPPRLIKLSDTGVLLDQVDLFSLELFLALTPSGVAVAPDGDVLVSSLTGIVPSVVTELTPALGFSGFQAPQGSGPLQVQDPRGLAFAPDGSVYVADSGNDRIQRWIEPPGSPH